jgi:hypothetical protein
MRLLSREEITFLFFSDGFTGKDGLLQIRDDWAKAICVDVITPL